MTMAEVNARERLDLERRQGAELSLREVAHAFDRELRVAGGLRIQGGDGGPALLRSDLQRLDLRLVEGPAELTDGRKPLLRDRPARRPGPGRSTAAAGMRKRAARS